MKSVPKRSSLSEPPEIVTQMLRITRLTDYAIVVLATAARGVEPVFSARSAAEQAQLPLPAVKKVLKCLAQHGLVTSLRGTQGGYRLERPAAQIALAEVIEAVEGPFALTDCGQGSKSASATGSDDPCEHRDHCSIQTNLQRVNAIVRRALSSVTLADMIGPGERDLVPLRILPQQSRNVGLVEGKAI
jgi:FeS assembly SUF system regulator